MSWRRPRVSPCARDQHCDVAGSTRKESRDHRPSKQPQAVVASPAGAFREGLALFPGSVKAGVAWPRLRDTDDGGADGIPNTKARRAVRFLMLVCRDESIKFNPQQRSSIGAEVQAWVSEMEQRKVRLQGDVLAAGDATTRVSIRDNEVIVEHGAGTASGGPASGFNLLACDDLDEAIEVSSKHPIARFGFIELRPIEET